jgi:mannose-6-phosphate isomerase-like protein (cupin superfamily)
MQHKTSIFKRTSDMITGLGFTIIGRDENRPWGGFLVIDESQATKFASHFFPGEELGSEKNKLSPKILLVAPKARLSWQYHLRRAEIWKCIEGKVGVVTSESDEEKTKHTLEVGEIIKLKQGERHRAIGLDQWGIIAEIWQHTDNNHPSDENDIVRLKDDYGR